MWLRGPGRPEYVEDLARPHDTAGAIGAAGRSGEKRLPPDGPWIAPDMPVGFTSEDYVGGRDPALAATLAVLERRR